MHRYVCYWCVFVAIWNQSRDIKKNVNFGHLSSAHCTYTLARMWRYMVFFRSQGGSARKTFGKHWFRDYRTHCMRDSHVAKASISYIGQNVKNAQKHPSSMRDSNKKPHCSGHPYDNQNKTQPQDSILMGYDAVSIGMQSLKFWNSLVPPL